MKTGQSGLAQMKAKVRPKILAKNGGSGRCSALSTELPRSGTSDASTLRMQIG